MQISIIIPTIGRDTLSQVLDSILATQNFAKFTPEVIVIGDGNFSRENILGQTEKYNFVKFLATGKNLGASQARNLGLEKTTGEIIAFIGDDTILEKNWLTETINFHTENPAKNLAVLGKIDWVVDYQNKPFYEWLNNNAQFSYAKIAKKGANWKNFYTSNISLKKEFIGKNRFFAEFTGWGFEDTEFGYQLHLKGLKLVYNPAIVVYHDHEQSLENLAKNFKNARQNAEIFEQLHPELKILPRGRKLFLLKTAVKIAKIFSPFCPRAKWWAVWKSAWLGEE